MIKKPLFLGDELSDFSISDLPQGRHHLFSARIVLKTQKPFKEGTPGGIVHEGESGVSETTMTAKTLKGIEQKVKELFFELYLYFRDHKLVSTPHRSTNYDALIAAIEQWENFRVAVKTQARCSEWRVVTQSLTMPHMAVLLLEVDDHPVWGKAEAIATAKASSVKTLDEALRKRFQETLCPGPWGPSGFAKSSRPEGDPMEVHLATVTIGVRRIDLLRARRQKEEASAQVSPAV